MSKCSVLECYSCGFTQTFDGATVKERVKKMIAAGWIATPLDTVHCPKYTEQTRKFLKAAGLQETEF